MLNSAAPHNLMFPSFSSFITCRQKIQVIGVLIHRFYEGSLLVNVRQEVMRLAKRMLSDRMHLQTLHASVYCTH